MQGVQLTHIIAHLSSTESEKAKDFWKIHYSNLPGMAVMCSGKLWGISYCIAFTLKMHFKNVVEPLESREKIKTAKRIIQILWLQ